MFRKVLVLMLFALVVSSHGTTAAIAAPTWNSRYQNHPANPTRLRLEATSTASAAPVAGEALARNAFATVLVFLGFCVIGTAYALYLKQKDR